MINDRNGCGSCGPTDRKRFDADAQAVQCFSAATAMVQSFSSHPHRMFRMASILPDISELLRQFLYANTCNIDGLSV